MTAISTFTQLLGSEILVFQFVLRFVVLWTTLNSVNFIWIVDLILDFHTDIHGRYGIDSCFIFNTQSTMTATSDKQVAWRKGGRRGKERKWQERGREGRRVEVTEGKEKGRRRQPFLHFTNATGNTTQCLPVSFLSRSPPSFQRIMPP